jgi:flagellar basal body-associated protein FliL
MHELTTGEIGLLIVMAVIVTAAMVAIMFWFLKKVARIEKERWGDRAHIRTIR